MAAKSTVNGQPVVTMSDGETRATLDTFASQSFNNAYALLNADIGDFILFITPLYFSNNSHFSSIKGGFFSFQRASGIYFPGEAYGDYLANNKLLVEWVDCTLSYDIKDEDIASTISSQRPTHAFNSNGTWDDLFKFDYIPEKFTRCTLLISTSRSSGRTTFVLCNSENSRIYGLPASSIQRVFLGQKYNIRDTLFFDTSEITFNHHEKSEGGEFFVGNTLVGNQKIGLQGATILDSLKFIDNSNSQLMDTFFGNDSAGNSVRARCCYINMDFMIDGGATSSNNIFPTIRKRNQTNITGTPNFFLNRGEFRAVEADGSTGVENINLILFMKKSSQTEVSLETCLDFSTKYHSYTYNSTRYGITPDTDRTDDGAALKNRLNNNFSLDGVEELITNSDGYTIVEGETDITNIEWRSVEVKFRNSTSSLDRVNFDGHKIRFGDWGFLWTELDLQVGFAQDDLSNFNLTSVLLPNNDIEETDKQTILDYASVDTDQKIFDSYQAYIDDNFKDPKLDLRLIDKTEAGIKINSNYSLKLDENSTSNFSIDIPNNLITIKTATLSGNLFINDGTLSFENDETFTGSVIDNDGDSFIRFLSTDEWWIFNSKDDARSNTNLVETGTGVFRFNFVANTTYYVALRNGTKIGLDSITPEASGENELDTGQLGVLRSVENLASKIDLDLGKKEGQAFYDSNNLIGATVGTVKYPLNSFAQIKKAREDDGITVFHIMSDLTIESVINEVLFLGRVNQYEVDLNGKNVQGCSFRQVRLVGTAGDEGLISPTHCILENTSEIAGFINECSLVGVITPKPTHDLHFLSCNSGEVGNHTFELDCADCNTNTIEFTDYSRGVEITNLTDENTMITVHGPARIIISSSCTNGSIQCYSPYKITDNSGANCSVNSVSLSYASLDNDSNSSIAQAVMDFSTSSTHASNTFLRLVQGLSSSGGSNLKLEDIQSIINTNSLFINSISVKDLDSDLDGFYTRFNGTVPEISILTHTEYDLDFVFKKEDNYILSVHTSTVLLQKKYSFFIGKVTGDNKFALENQVSTQASQITQIIREGNSFDIYDDNDDLTPANISLFNITYSSKDLDRLLKLSALIPALLG